MNIQHKMDGSVRWTLTTPERQTLSRAARICEALATLKDEQFAPIAETVADELSRLDEFVAAVKQKVAEETPLLDATEKKGKG